MPVLIEDLPDYTQPKDYVIRVEELHNTAYTKSYHVTAVTQREAVEHALNKFYEYLYCYEDNKFSVDVKAIVNPDEAETTAFIYRIEHKVEFTLDSVEVKRKKR